MEPDRFVLYMVEDLGPQLENLDEPVHNLDETVQFVVCNSILWQQPVLAKNTSQMSHNTAQWVNQMALCGFL